MTVALIGLLSTLAGIALLFAQRWFTAKDNTASLLDEAKKQLAIALASDHKTDAVMWAKRVKELGGLILVSFLLSGCFSTTKPAPLVLGERWITVVPDQSITVPKLTPPAKQWYLIDDVGLLEGLGINPTAK